MRLVLGRSCLVGVNHCFDLRDPPPSAFVPSRAVADHAAFARWLVDPTITADERAARVAAGVRYGLTERHRLARNDATTPTPTCRSTTPSWTTLTACTANNRSGTKRDGAVQRCSVVRDGLLAYPMTQ
jgi:hypothetical protein